MFELLKELKEQSLLTPVSTMVTAFLAFTAVLINNWFVRSNVEKQIKAQAKENDKRRLLEKQLVSNSEKAKKLEELHDYLHTYIEESNKCIHSASMTVEGFLVHDNEKEMKFLTLQKEHEQLWKYRSKAEVLAAAYLDKISDEFSIIKECEDKIAGLLHDLVMWEILKSDGDNQHLKSFQDKARLADAHAIDVNSQIKDTIEELQKKVIDELKATR